MFVDLVSGNGYGRFNRKLAKLAGLRAAVYWSEMANILERVHKKKTYDDNYFFTLDRRYVEEQCALSLEEQLVCDQALVNLGFLEVDPADPNRLKVDMKAYIELIVCDNEKELTKAAKVAKVSRSDKAASKRAGIVNRLQSRIVDPDVDIVEALKKWVDAAYDKGMQTNAQMDLFVSTVNSYSQDKQVRLDIINTATARAYKVADWAIQIYEKDHKFSASRIQTQQKVSTGVNKEISF